MICVCKMVFYHQILAPRNNQTRPKLPKIKKRPFWIVFRNDLTRKVLDHIYA